MSCKKAAVLLKACWWQNAPQLSSLAPPERQPLPTSPPQLTAHKQQPVRPVPAAALVLLRENRTSSIEVLLGRRHDNARFMPGIYVVPGGRVEPEDGQPSGFEEELPPLPPGLDKATQGRAAAIARAALRETYEETGLLYGSETRAQKPTSGAATPSHQIWSCYAGAGIRPVFEQLWFIARAITPTFSPRRFHTRFLLGDGRFVQGQITGDGELEDINWYPLSDINRLSMANITKLVLEEALRHYNIIKNDNISGETRPAAMFRWTGSKHQGGVSATRTTLQT